VQQLFRIWQGEMRRMQRQGAAVIVQWNQILSGWIIGLNARKEAGKK
jgi:hypothetical protein